MKVRFMTWVLVTCVLVLGLAAARVRAVTAARAAAPPAAAPGKAAMKRLTGVEAELFVQKLKAANPAFAEAQAKSAQRVAAKKWKRVGVLSVEISGAPKSRSTPAKRALAGVVEAFFPTAHAAQDESNEEGYVVSTGYDDGNDDNQEANLFVGLYDSYDSWISIDIQMVMPDGGVTWYREWAAADTGDREHPTREVSFEEPSGVYRTPQGKVVLAKFQVQGCRCVMMRHGGSAGCMLDQALSDSWSVCMTAVGLCTRRTWLAAWACMETWGGRACAASFGGGMIRAVSQWFGNCRAEGFF